LYKTIYLIFLLTLLFSQIDPIGISKLINKSQSNEDAKILIDLVVNLGRVALRLSSTMNTRSASSSATTPSEFEELRALIEQLKKEVKDKSPTAPAPLDWDSACRLILAESSPSQEVKQKWVIFLDHLKLKKSFSEAYSLAVAGQAVTSDEINFHRMADLLREERQADRKSQPRKSSRLCTKCQRTSHSTAQCFAKTKKDGSPLD
jgi:hypothetical protein